MKGNPASVESQGLDYIDLEAAAIALTRYLRDAQERWIRHDRLIADKSYEETRLARCRNQNGRLTASELQDAYRKIDSILGEYDDRTTYRFELVEFLRSVIHRFHAAAQIDLSHRKGMNHAA